MRPWTWRYMFWVLGISLAILCIGLNIYCYVYGVELSIPTYKRYPVYDMNGNQIGYVEIYKGNTPTSIGLTILGLTVALIGWLMIYFLGDARRWKI